jgi:type I restriction enzyme S subunit
MEVIDEIHVDKYPLYKDSGVKWLGEIPEHWEIRRLKFLANCFPSNIDKHSKIGESKVRLCNYTDVYKNDFITDNLDFMVATANQEQIKKFSLLENDVVITKDSETAQDIAVPAFVSEKLYNVVCGYHLAIVRPYSNTYGNYLFRSFQSKLFNLQFEICSNGITRVGLGVSDLKKGYFLLPPTEEQIVIAEFLERKIASINQAIAIKGEQINLLKEHKEILIHKAVTRGLNTNVKMKKSGWKWIGEIPEHWEVVKNRTLFYERNEAGNELLPILSVSIHTAVSSEELSGDDNRQGSIRIEDKSSYKIVMPNDVAFNMMRAWQGAIGAVRTNGMVSPAYIVARPNAKIGADFFEYQYRTRPFIQQMDRFSKGITDFRKRLYWNEFKNLFTVLPPKAEQDAISAYIQIASSKIASAISLKEEEIEKIKEYKATLINSAVTGKIKVC